MTLLESVASCLCYKKDEEKELKIAGVTVDLYVVLRAKKVRDGGNASITMELFEVGYYSGKELNI